MDPPSGKGGPTPRIYLHVGPGLSNQPHRFKDPGAVHRPHASCVFVQGVRGYVWPFLLDESRDGG
eukprot:4796772-Prorocentrum_lima.AAC.1